MPQEILYSTLTHGYTLFDRTANVHPFYRCCNSRLRCAQAINKVITIYVRDG